MSDLRSLVRRGRDLDREIKAKTEELKSVKARLIAAGAGTHDGTDGAAAQVIFPAASLKPKAAAVETVRAAVGKVDPKLFDRLFTAVTEFKPVKGFREIMAVVMADHGAAELVAACEEPSAPQVRFS